MLYFKEGAHSPILTTFNLTHPLSIRNGLRISISNRISTLIWTICVSRACAALKNLCDVNTGCRKKKQKNSCRRSTTVNTNFDISSLQVQVLSYMLTRRQEYYLENWKEQRLKMKKKSVNKQKHVIKRNRKPRRAKDWEKKKKKPVKQTSKCACSPDNGAACVGKQFALLNLAAVLKKFEIVICSTWTRSVNLALKALEFCQRFTTLVYNSVILCF